jgi:predicted GNAT family acetyltransferase
LRGVSDNPEQMQALVSSILPMLPRRFYAHLNPGVKKALSEIYELTSLGQLYVMSLRHPEAFAAIDTAAVVQLSSVDIEAVKALYQTFPTNHFTDRMLETGYYFGVCEQGQLVSIAGIHVYAERYSVAVLGGITTHPDFRRRGLSRKACARLLQSLHPTTTNISLNVHVENEAAIASYRQLGFEILMKIEAYSCTAK